MDRNLPRKGRRCGNPFVLVSDRAIIVVQGCWWLCQTARHDAICRCFSLLKMTITSHTREDLGLSGICGPDRMFLCASVIVRAVMGGVTCGSGGELPCGQTRRGTYGQTRGKGPSSKRHVGREAPKMPHLARASGLGQAFHLNVGIKPVLADCCTFEVLPIVRGVVASTSATGKDKKGGLPREEKKKRGRLVEWVEKASFDLLNKLFVISTNERHYQTLLAN
ncbi:hypothetical protein CK203_055090 [Vitis vinifera]|uniref:Uncharacterized protein n=1 Tax=Vitis vinifera TaxID=29760 RepID=A0A438GUE9_VITVI|nr:hypothetical protein CK203_055090 [Vitis vinifera]